MTVASTFRYLTHHPLYITGSGTPSIGPISVSVVDSGRETPGPIPNPEAKPARADGTALGRVWESRLPPTQQLQNMIKQPVCHTHVVDGLLFVMPALGPCSWSAVTSRQRNHACKPAGGMSLHTSGFTLSASSSLKRRVK